MVAEAGQFASLVLRPNRATKIFLQKVCRRTRAYFMTKNKTPTFGRGLILVAEAGLEPATSWL